MLPETHMNFKHPLQRRSLITNMFQRLVSHTNKCHTENTAKHITKSHYCPNNIKWPISRCPPRASPPVCVRLTGSISHHQYRAKDTEAQGGGRLEAFGTPPSITIVFFSTHKIMNLPLKKGFLDPNVMKQMQRMKLMTM